MGEQPGLVVDPPDYALHIERLDRDGERARAWITGPDMEHSGTGLYAYIETLQEGVWTPRIQLRQVGAIFEEPSWHDIRGGRVVELQPLLSAADDMILAIPRLGPGEHRIRKDVGVMGMPMRLHTALPADF